MAYSPYVARIEQLTAHPNADRLKLAVVSGGHTVVVGLDTAEGDIGLFFPEGGQLSEEYAAAANLVRRINPDTGINEGGMFETNRRVKATNIRGVKSMGFWTRWDTFAVLFADQSRLPLIGNKQVGQDLNEVNGVTLATKYYTDATRAAIASGAKGQVEKQVSEFKEHIDTGQFASGQRLTPDGAKIYITEKLHGTSGRTYKGRARNLESWWDRVKAFFGRPTVRVLTGSRRVVKREGMAGYHGSDQFRFDISNALAPSMKVGETLYYEIVGWANGKTIMPSANYGALAKHEKVKDPAVKNLPKVYGDVAPWSYGTDEGQLRVFVYRITQDGKDLSWSALVRRAFELGVAVPPLLDAGELEEGGLWDREDLARTVASLTEGASELDPRHIREGVIVRWELGDLTGWLKNKSWTFAALEGRIRDQADYVDLEEVS